VTGVVNLAEKFSRFADHWNPRVVGELNGQQVKVARFLGEFTWHRHDDADELFLVVHGTLEMRFRDRIATLRDGEFIIVPRGVEHCPVAREEVQVILFEPAGVSNTGNVRDSRTRDRLEHL
jgi:mannose-6-phosphate isomerase-like protein (cupin superfamily)